MIGREYFILIPWTMQPPNRWTYGTDYNYGIGKPHYPVPAIRTYHQWGWTYDRTRMTYRMALRRTTGWVNTKNKWWYSTIYRDNVNKTGWQGKRY